MSKPNLTANIDSYVSKMSAYEKKIKGTTNTPAQMRVELKIIINNQSIYHPLILTNGSFEQTVYLFDGDNKIEILANNINTNETESIIRAIELNIMPNVPQKESILHNFIANDEKEIQIHLGNSKLSYVDKHAGDNKEVIINEPILSHFFELEGPNANFYRISRNSLPMMQSTIIKRPIVIMYDNIEKIYDSSNDVTGLYSTFKLDNGYNFIDIQEKYNDYINSGFVRGTTNRLMFINTIFNRGELLPKDIQLSNIKVDLSSFRIEIDNMLGISDNTGDIYFDDSAMHMQIHENGLLEFKTFEAYEVKQFVQVSYKYHVNNSNSNVQTIQSDKGYVEVQFSKASFRDRGVTQGWEPIAIDKLELIGGIKGNNSKDYQIANYFSQGRIIPRPIIAYIECLDKIYDGTKHANYKPQSQFYNGLYNSISTDNIELNIGNELEFKDANVGTNKDIYIVTPLSLNGKDRCNYTLTNTNALFRANITQREIEIKINHIRFLRASKTWELEYELKNVIPYDNISITFNSNTGNDIQVTDVLTNKLIISTFFDYDFNPNYQFVIPTQEIKTIDTSRNNTLNSALNTWTQTGRIPQSDTVRLDIQLIKSLLSTGNVKYELIGTEYFESVDNYKLLDNSLIYISNIKLNTKNEKSINYKLINTSEYCNLKII